MLVSVQFAIAIYDNKTGMVSIDGNVELSRGGGSKLQGGKSFF